MNKSRFLTFCFAFIPGAGQMYLGMMKRGVSLMIAFSLVIMAIVVLYLPVFSILLPVIWFYAFFDTFNLRAMPYEQRLYMQDKFLFNLDDMLSGKWLSGMKQRHMLMGGLLIAVGVYLLYNFIVRPLLWQLAPYFPQIDRVVDAIPACVVALAVIYLGLKLVAGAKKAPPAEEGFLPYGGEKHDGE